MEKINMANMNTLFKKGYLLAGVMIAANMFVVNEMKAMNSQTGADIPGGQGSGQGAKGQSMQQNYLKINDFPPQNEVQTGGGKVTQKNKVLSTYYYLARIILTFLGH